MGKLANIYNWAQVEYEKDIVASTSVLFKKPFNGYVGWTGYGNLGDEAVYQSIQALMPGLHIKSFRSAKPLELTTKLTRRQIQLKSLALGGGTLINQSPVWFDECSRAIKLGVPVYCIGTGVASNNSADTPPDSRTGLLADWVKLLPQFEYVGVRGPKAYDTLLKAGFKAEVVGDTAIALSPMSYKKRVGKKVVGLNISPGTDNIMHGDMDRYLNEMVKFADKITSNGYALKILPIWKDDLEISKTLFWRLRARANAEIKIAYDSVDHYLHAINTCDFFLGQKLHATIFATMLRIPSIMLEYRPKCLDYMTSIGFEKYSVRTDTLNSEMLYGFLEDLNNSTRSVQNELNEAILHYRQLQYRRAHNIIPKLLS